MTAEQIKQQFRSRGETITEWARRNGYRRTAVYRVLNGQEKGHYGQAHEIAMKLGMKAAIPSEQLAA